jgi:hypothetical protein
MHELEGDSGSCVVLLYYDVIVLPHLSMSTKKISKEVAAAIIGGLFTLGAGVSAALIGSWNNFFPPSHSLALAQGDWKIIEKLKLKQDSSEIDWKYKASIINTTTLSMEGKKVKVDNKKITREEESVTSVYKLTFKDNNAEGKYTESNAKKSDLSGTVKLTFSDTFTSFEGSTYDNSGREVSTIRGSK